MKPLLVLVTAIASEIESAHLDIDLAGRGSRQPRDRFVVPGPIVGVRGAAIVTLFFLSRHTRRARDTKKHKNTKQQCLPPTRWTRTFSASFSRCHF